MPGNACTQDSECYYSTTADGSGTITSSCVNGACYGMAVGGSCLASHQCVVGSFCSSTTSTCTALGGIKAACASDSECSSRYTCFDGACSKRYTQANGKSCSSTENCKSGLYCNAGTCASALTTGRTATPCDLQGSACGTGMECSCQNFTAQVETATCASIPGTYLDMASIEDSAYSCLDKHSCGSDANSNATVACITGNCLASYCTYLTRSMNELWSEYPSCLVSRMVGSQPYYALLQACSAYTPTASETASSSGSVVSATFAWASLVLAAFFFLDL